MVFKRAPITAKGDDKTTKFKVDAIGCLRYTWYQIMLGWETYKYYLVLWNRRTPQHKANPTQEKLG